MTSILYFNTSHVEVYRNKGSRDRLEMSISIHLMLKFINMNQKKLHMEINFNTSHVEVYRFKHFIIHEISLISIHLMLKFII